MAPNSEEKNRYSQREILRRLEDKQDKMEEKLTRMAGALIGDSELNVPGLFQRVHKLEKSESNRMWWHGIIATITASITLVIAKWNELFPHK